MLLTMSEKTFEVAATLLFVHQVCYPKHPLSLLDLCRVQIETRTSLMKSYTMGEPNGCCDEEERWLRIRGS